MPPPPRRQDRPNATSAAAKLAVARMPRAPGSADRVELRLILVLDRQVAERLTARAISEEKNLGQLVMEIVEAAAHE
jgi:hypothetical protein